jgi:acyl-coenzyme A synthetase/AMP-(fatty) acid ligase
MEPHLLGQGNQASMTSRRRAVICVDNPWDFIPSLGAYSIMIVNPDSAPARMRYLLDNADWSLLINKDGEHYRSGGSYPDERVLWYTSGTTGDSKFCIFSDEQIRDMAHRIIQSYDITANDRYVSLMPLWHAHGQGFYWAAKQARCEIIFSSPKKIRELESHDPTFVTAIPDVLRLIEPQRLPSLRFVRSASSALPPDLYQRLEKRFQVPVIEAFGMTEALSHCFTNPLHGVRKIGSIGLPDGVDAKITDGSLMIKGPTVCTPGWYDTGDLADVDEDGYYRILGRSRDQINVRGIKLNPLSLESQMLSNIPDLDQCVIFGSDRVMCIYVGDCTDDDIRDYLISLGTHCRPVSVEKVDRIPVSPSAKISRQWLLDHYSSA